MRTNDSYIPGKKALARTMIRMALVALLCSLFITGYHIGEAKNLLAPVMVDGKWGYIDARGDSIISPRYEAAEVFSQGLAAVKINGKRGYIDTKGNMVIAPRYDYYNGSSFIGFSEGWALVTSGEGKSFIDGKGNVVLGVSQYGAVWTFSQGLARVWSEEKKKYGYIDKRGNLLVDAQYDYALDFSEGLAAVQVNGKWGYIDTKGEMAIAAQYEGWVRDFSEGMAAVEVNHKWGFINRQGEMIIAPQYDWVWDFIQGLACVKTGGKYGYIDVNGNTVIAPRYDEARAFSEVGGL